MIETGYAGPRRTWFERAIAAARLDSGAFEEVEADSSATGQAALVVVISAFAQGVGSIGNGSEGVIGSIVGSLLGWVVWSAVTYFVGVTVFKGTATVGELLRTLGFAQAPGVLFVTGIVPFFGAIVSIVAAVWILIAGIIAIRQALDISTAKAVVTAFIGWCLLIIPLAVFGAAAFFSFR